MTGVLVLGSGKRVREAALPAFRCMRPSMEIRGVWAKNAKEIEVGGETFDVGAFGEFQRSDLDGVDLVYIAVGKGAVPSVLTRLVEHDVSKIDLFIDTPVVRFKFFRHASKLNRFRNAWVSEDCITLPWIDTIRAATETVGRPKHVLFDRSAYAYHGVATAKEILGSTGVRTAKLRRQPDGTGRRELRFANGGVAEMIEPRDYSAGHVVVTGEKGSVSDRAGAADHLLEPIVDGSDWVGFRIGDVETRLAGDEVELLRGGDATKSIIARMDDLKRLGFLRLLRRIETGADVYPATEALDDMFVDYHLEKVGKYTANPFTSYRSPLARAALSLLTLAAR